MAVLANFSAPPRRPLALLPTPPLEAPDPASGDGEREDTPALSVQVGALPNPRQGGVRAMGPRAVSEDP